MSISLPLASIILFVDFAIPIVMRPSMSFIKGLVIGAKIQCYDVIEPPPSHLGCSVLGRGAEPLVRTQFLEHPPTLNFGANHLKKWIQHPQKPPIPFLSPHNPHHGGGFWGGGQRVRAQLEQS